ncbi:glycerol uptake facilitator protein [Iodidimonas nitroreducens]|uniref:Glycerol uptake facilitator protein n=1 Tax=Iodidimonas nitroreducens TaxID=1236968 RepID=A0A5A7N9G7_9PROT|nr:MIP/aquaporin family protein [Iodidimonas nitroreducens]GAK32729.1 glycerol uptake facilitator protein [alpha proteobacterium Q-1]GER04932.1 glycerol uptake facilitator protein [Iodidimonas nitroreducens]
MTPFLGELIGTMVLILFGGGVVGGVVLRHSKAEGAGWIVITAGWGMGVAVAVYMVGGISGAHINPAVTLGLAISNAFPWADVPLYIAGQLLGAFIGAVLVWLHYYPHWATTPDPEAKRAVFATAPAIAHGPANLLSEVLGSFILVLGVLAIGANTFTEGMLPLVVGLLVFAIGLSLGGTTGYAINPARDLGPRIAHALLPIPGKGPSDWRYAWVPVVGPCIGGLLGGIFYRTVFVAPNPLAIGGFLALLIVIAGFFALQSRKERAPKPE